MTHWFGRAALAAIAVAALGASGASGASAQMARGAAPAYAGSPYIAYGPVCDRAALRDCQAAARHAMTTCHPFPGRLVCADQILHEQSACMAATGCD